MRQPIAMTIRFRCVHCQQLLGIANRKAGMEVCCPKCKRQVGVPLISGQDQSLERSAEVGKKEVRPSEHIDIGTLVQEPTGSVAKAFSAPPGMKTPYVLYLRKGGAAASVTTYFNRDGTPKLSMDQLADLGRVVASRM